MKAFFDTKLTGLTKDSTLISLAIETETGRTFYAEFTDYNVLQVDDWIRDNIIANLQLTKFTTTLSGTGDVTISGSTEAVAVAMEQWLSECAMDSNEPIQMWGDMLAYDWVLLMDLFDGALIIPPYLDPIPMDLSTLFYVCDLDPVTARYEFSQIEEPCIEHYAPDDVKVMRACYTRLHTQSP